MVGSILAIGFLSFIVWGHHMFITGMNPFLGSVFVYNFTYCNTISCKSFNYITTLWKGYIGTYAGHVVFNWFGSTFITGGVTGIILADAL